MLPRPVASTTRRTATTWRGRLPKGSSPTAGWSKADPGIRRQRWELGVEVWKTFNSQHSTPNFEVPVSLTLAVLAPEHQDDAGHQAEQEEGKVDELDGF